MNKRPAARLAAALITAAWAVGTGSCSGWPPYEPGCEWVWNLPAPGNEYAYADDIQCSENGTAIITYRGLETRTNLPCEPDPPAPPEVDLEPCLETLAAWSGAEEYEDIEEEEEP